ncbi:hypothetical protein D3C81_1398850 [compost metagenome]
MILVFVFSGTLIFYNFNKINYINDELSTEDNAIGMIDNIARVTNQFKIENKTYNILSESEKAELKFLNTINDKDIGDKLMTISKSVDEILIGKEVYRYLPAGCDGIVAVKVDNEYKLFKFFWFDSYINNKDEDTKAYLEIYGINKGEDISKIQFIRNGNSVINEITDKSRILEFYNYYSIIPDSSDKYFNKLFNYKKSKEQVEPEVKDAPSSIPGSEGFVGDALGNSVTIRIYNQKGVYFSSEYYPNISFISRHEVNEDFKRFLDEYVK